ncbi:sugar transferase [Flavobacteriaceae bacterium F89]|uniref:Sugar transferase n=1 Tax=Cerina litoralis TaxID=2874477 RepID=A0AAE3EUJ9_9FLAO|nr:sugar transferase [Cerina litoralis]MCG2461183.1 sugar transferase [Cerina litoralis]
MYNPNIKRLLDILISMIGLILLAPIIVVIIVLLLFTNNGKPFFTQLRPGRNGKPFKIIKFKTMSDLKPGKTEVIPSAARITRVGAVIRKYSLDELLQMVNVLKGDMSIVGPRPLLMDYLPLYSDLQARRHLVRPGITGWAQVNGRNALSWNQKFEYDLWYVDHVAFKTDLKIIFKTFLKVVKKEGVNKGAEVTMPKWEGNV